MRLDGKLRRLASQAASVVRHPGRIDEWVRQRSRLVASSFPSAVQVGLAAGAAWWAASVLLTWDNPIYAPIGAVVATGTGQNRMADRPVRLGAGMVVAVAVAGVVVDLFGTGVWQIVVVTTLTTVLGRFLFNDTLARTYSAFHGAVIAAMGVSGVIPEQLIEASIGAAMGIVVVHLVFPPRVEPALLSTVEQAGDRARRSLQGLASALRTGQPDELEGALEAARQVEAYLAPPDGREKFARQVTRLAPARWRQRQTVERYVRVDRRLESVLLQAAAAVRVAQPLTFDGHDPRPELSAAVDELDMALAWMVRPPFDAESRDHIAKATERTHGHLASVELSDDVNRLLYEELKELGGRIDDVAHEMTTTESS